MGLLTPQEVRRLNAQFIRECREQLIKQGQFSRGFTVKATALRSCVKEKWKKYKMEYASKLTLGGGS